MPQIAQIDATWASQLFWLVIAFLAIYLVIGRGMLPKIEATVDARDQRIASDLREAEAARAAADALEEANRTRTEADRAEALKLTQAAKERAAREAEAKVKASDAEIGARVGVAEASVRERAQAAMADIEAVAAEAAQEMVQRLSGAQVSRDEAASAVRNALHG